MPVITHGGSVSGEGEVEVLVGDWDDTDMYSYRTAGYGADPIEMTRLDTGYESVRDLDNGYRNGAGTLQEISVSRYTSRDYAPRSAYREYERPKYMNGGPARERVRQVSGDYRKITGPYREYHSMGRRTMYRDPPRDRYQPYQQIVPYGTVHRHAEPPRQRDDQPVRLVQYSKIVEAPGKRRVDEAPWVTAKRQPVRERATHRVETPITRKESVIDDSWVSVKVRDHNRARPEVHRPAPRTEAPKVMSVPEPTSVSHSRPDPSYIWAPQSTAIEGPSMSEPIIRAPVPAASDPPRVESARMPITPIPAMAASSAVVHEAPAVRMPTPPRVPTPPSIRAATPPDVYRPEPVRMPTPPPVAPPTPPRVPTPEPIRAPTPPRIPTPEPIRAPTPPRVPTPEPIHAPTPVFHAPPPPPPPEPVRVPTPPSVHAPTPPRMPTPPRVPTPPPFQAPQAPEVDLPRYSVPDAPEIEGRRFSGPDVDVNPPDIEARRLSGPDYNIDAPNIEARRLSGPDYNIDAPNIEARRLSGPDYNIDAPDIDARRLSGPDYNIDAPNMEAPRFSGPEYNVDAPNIEARRLSGPDVNIDAPDIEAPRLSGPEYNVNAPEIEVPRLSGPDYNVNAPDMEAPRLSGPDYNVNAPEIEAPRLSGPDYNVNAPDIEAPRLSNPNVNMDAPNINAPRMSGPEGNISYDPNIPRADVQPPAPRPAGHVHHASSPDGSPACCQRCFGKPKRPKTRTPQGAVPYPVQGAQLQAPGGFDGPSVQTPYVEAPRGSLEGPSMQAPGVEAPRGSMEGPAVRAPAVAAVAAHGPDMDTPDYQRPDFNSPTHRQSIDNPSYQYPPPRVDGPQGAVDVPGAATPQPTFQGHAPSSQNLIDPEDKGYCPACICCTLPCFKCCPKACMRRPNEPSQRMIKQANTVDEKFGWIGVGILAILAIAGILMALGFIGYFSGGTPPISGP
ncbi:proline-rich extensin-like protein EPR1 isoform X2 [Branchiostoma floridae]|uniref:Proline-rich extensin-like protein EPR1 isoform X2 n=1 Tax=Branchiostoma floridae TaxID=7739 RepID=A0A9J7L1T1_BRAFL|nr:proline-rich extensin-like protein EPR1 isoform X2 [Branchiostoma floridae]